MTALLGPNGAGKSTLVSLAAGLTRADAGTVRVLGADPAGRGGRAMRRQIGLAPQEIGVYPQLSVTTNLRCFAELRRREQARRARARRRAARAVRAHRARRPRRRPACRAASSAACTRRSRSSTARGS